MPTRRELLRLGLVGGSTILAGRFAGPVVGMAGQCPAPSQTNAVRFRTRDGRYLQAVNGGTAGLVATNVIPHDWETFLLVSPTPWPLASGDPITLEVCNANWGPSGYLVRVEAIAGRTGSVLVDYQFGGPDAGVWVTGCCLSTPGYAGWADEWTFSIEKAGGGAITTGDEISLATSDGFYFRTTGAEDRALVDADGTAPGQADTVFIVEFNQVAAGLGWGPAATSCDTCGAVTGTVTDADNGKPIAGALVEAQETNFKATTGADGRFTLSDFTLSDPGAQVCVPSGNRTLDASANTYQPMSVGPISVPAGGGIDVPIQLNCTVVSGRVVSTTGQQVNDLTVYLVEPGTRNPVAGPDGLISAITATDGTFVLRCVPHGNSGAWTAGAAVTLITVPPLGLVDVIITLSPPGCGDVVGTVTDGSTGKPIAVAKVKVIGSNPGEDEATTSDGSDGRPIGSFRIECVSGGSRTIMARMPGYRDGTGMVTVPATGASNPIDIKLQPVAAPPIAAIIIRLDWGAQPPDLDSHLSGPNGQGGRFHLFYGNRTAPPVDFAALDTDDTSAQGPEHIVVRSSPSAGTYVAGDYHYWVHSYTPGSIFRPPDQVFAPGGLPPIDAGPSGAVVSVPSSDALVTVFADGVQVGQFSVAAATGDPSDRLWHVVNLQISATGTVTLNAIQLFKPGGSNDVL